METPRFTDKELIGRLRYQGKQYSRGQTARGGGIEDHYLTQAANRLEALTADADAEAKLASADAKDSTVRDFRKVAAGGMVKEMVDRFLGWTLPHDFNPDAGVTFTPTDLQKSGVPGWPTGTNLFTADQADKMIGYVAAPLLAKLLMYIHEERFNTTPQPAPDAQAAVSAAYEAEIIRLREVLKNAIWDGVSDTASLATWRIKQALSTPASTSVLDEYKADIKRLVDYFLQKEPVMVRVAKDSLQRVPVYPADEIGLLLAELKAKYNLP